MPLWPGTNSRASFTCASDGVVTPAYGRAYSGLIPGARFIFDPTWLDREPVGLAWLGWSSYSIVTAAFRVVIGPSFHQHRLTLRYLPNVLTYLWWGLTWMPLVFLALWRVKDQGTWVKTQHTRGLALSDVPSGERPPT